MLQPALQNVELPQRSRFLSIDYLRTRAAAVFLGGLLLTASAKLSVPFAPVPFTLQTLAVMLIGACLGARLGGLTVAVYLFEGMCGLPVLAGTPEKGLGLIYMMGPTGGFLFGFLPAAVLVGILSERGWLERTDRAAAAMLLGVSTIYVLGLTWLGMVVGWNKPILALGLTPFVHGEALKIALASLIAPRLSNLRR